MVNKDEIEELLEELKMKTTGEIKKYQRMLANKNGILEDAKQRAENIIAKATEQASALINDHEIMQQAYIQGNDMVVQAQEQAQKIIAEAKADADAIRMGAIQYTDSLLVNVQNTITYSMENITMRYEAYMKLLQKTLEMVVANRNELNVPQPHQTSQAKTPVQQQDVQSQNSDYEGEEDGFEDYTVEIDGDDMEE